MIFEYFKVNRRIIRPIIPIILKSSNKVALYSALIDSGSDYCIFGLDVAEGMDIKLNSNHKIKFIGIGKEEIEGFWSNIEMRIGEKTYQTKIIFADISSTGYGILGQQGFFDHFDVRLSYQKQTIDIEPLKISN